MSRKAALTSKAVKADMSLRLVGRPLTLAAVALVVGGIALYAMLGGSAAKPGEHVEATGASEEPEWTVAAVKGLDAGRAELAQADECDTLVASRWLVARQMENAVDDYIESLSESGRSDLEVALVRDLATTAGVSREVNGIDVSRTRPSSRGSLGFGRSSARWLAPGEEHAFSEAFDQDGVRGILILHRADATALRARWGTTTLLGRLIRRGPERFQRLSGAELAELPIGTHELVAAIEADLPISDFEAFLEAASVSDDQFDELARTAALQGRAGIFRRMTDLGADPGRRGSILDDLAVRLWSAPSARVGDYADVANLLIAGGARPHLPSSLAVIESRLPEANPLTLHSSTLALAQDPTLRTEATRFAELLLDWSKRVDSAEAIERRCSDRSRLESRRAPRSSSLGIAQRLNHQRNLSRRFEGSAEYKEAADLLAGLEDKLTAAIASGDLERWRLDAADRLSDLAHAGRWHEAIAAADELQDTYGVLLDIALSRGAPVDVIGELIDRSGEEMPADAIMTLVSGSLVLKSWSGADEIVAALAGSRGLNLHYVDPEGHNAVTFASEYFYDLSNLRQVNDDAFRLVQYLVGESVTMKPNPRGLDALDRVLLKVLETPQTLGPGVSLLRYLIDHGGAFEHSHRQIADMISNRDPGAYARLIDAFPELRSAI